jgi:hypothetical protein
MHSKRRGNLFIALLLMSVLLIQTVPVVQAVAGVTVTLNISSITIPQGTAVSS